MSAANPHDQSPSKVKREKKKKAVVAALKKTLGVVSFACEYVGIETSTFYRWIASDPDFAQEVNDMENIALDYMEHALYKKIKAGSDTAIIFGLKCKGKKRGWIDRTIIEHDGKVNVDVINKNKSIADCNDPKKLKNYIDKMKQAEKILTKKDNNNE